MELLIILLAAILILKGLHYLRGVDLKEVIGGKKIDLDKYKSEIDSSSEKIKTGIKTAAGKINSQYKKSGWVFLYQFCGWISLAGGGIMLIMGLVNEDITTSLGPFVSAFLAGLSCFFAAHLIRLLEKGVHHLENLDSENQPYSRNKAETEQ